MDFDKKYGEYISFFENSLKTRFQSLDAFAPDTIKAAMRYAVEDGGKRVRPTLLFATAEMLGGDKERVKELALAIEFIHSYSLVHDDLPAMDNDDYRRGKFSTHKKFGEDIGILAGDALLNYAFETMLDANNIDSNYIAAMKIIAESAGYSGMIGGQVLDLIGEKNDSPTEKDLYEIYFNKTAKLILAPLLAASRVYNDKYYDQLFEYGYNIGVLFQITDDIMDVSSTFEIMGKTPNKDKDENKLTSIKVFGLDGAKLKAEYHYKKAKSIIEKIDNVGFLTNFTDKIYYRNK